MTTAKKSAKSVSDIPLQKSRRVIQLDQSQYALYLSGQLDIYSPDAMRLESIGHFPQSENRTRFVDQLSLVEALVVNCNGQLELSERAIASLADLLNQSQKMIAQ
ncbi:hypothetical protein [Cellvibrio sp. QJXJ]|uniref:hypothetical protein n=1 Tax=Cellvibrio sp. QJXJ TaxID=2964606 RepID=UPI0021C28E1F|nr:hypothetical protein [Cellvibrio sp. QJXJ]UUA73098.1 hypothetical protein NNX04_01295 [Cellvibrio sp. QJXJ]